VRLIHPFDRIPRGRLRAIAAAHFWAGLVLFTSALFAAAALAKRLWPRARRALPLAPLLVPLAALAAAPRTPDVVTAGRESFQRLCAVCHGVDARGGGPLAIELLIPVPDLTTIRARNFGNFPYGRLRDAIDGRREIAAHGARDMPVWGRILVEQRGAQPGSEVAASGEITALLAYLESIQVVPEPEAPAGNR
jgi:mono/diheme cytochrome c family protein